MTDILRSLWADLCSAGPLEQSATVLGVVGVWLMIRQSLWAFPVGLVQVSLSALVFYNSRFYADMKLQGLFFIVLAYGWWHWTHPRAGARAALPVGRLNTSGWILAIGSGLAGTVLWGLYLAHNTDAAMPFRDSFIASFSVVAQWLQARKRLENWYGWIVVNAAAVPVYWLGGMYWFSVLYFLFLLMAIGGLREWRASERSARAALQDSSAGKAVQSA